MPDELTAYARGVMGETAACDHLCRKGMEMLDRRYRSPHGEIDLIMLDGEVLVFVEVKTRRNDTYGDASDAVTPMKMRRLIFAAEAYIKMKELEKVNRNLSHAQRKWWARAFLRL